MRKRRPLFTLLTLLVLAGACLVVALAAWIVLNRIPNLAEQTFGPPAPGLSLPQRVYLGARLLLNEPALTRPVDPQGSSRPFRVTLGEPTGELIQRLQAEGFIGDSESFRLFLQYSGLDTTLQAGDYELGPAMTPVQIARALQDATPTEVTFTILPGWRVEEIAASLPTSGLAIPAAEFLAAVSARPEGLLFSADLPPTAGAEGFLFPDQYRLPRDLDSAAFLHTLMSNFAAKMDDQMVQGFQNQGLDVYEAVILASIVEREAVSDEEMPLIASVFLNRLAAGIKLDSDPTVQYALGFNTAQNTWWTNPLSLEDLKVDSPYNTYLYSGLPPGPIANPGLPALQAVAYPAQTPYYYFRSACDGSGRHVFAETFEEHLGNACP